MIVLSAFLILATPLYIAAWWLILRRTFRGGPFVRGLIAQLVIGLFTGVVQFWTAKISLGQGIESLLFPLLGNSFNTGGYTVRFVFESLVKPLEWLVGHRSATVMSNMSFYLVLLWTQMGVLASLFALRWNRRGTWKDPLILLWLALVLVNSLVNVQWPWWGS